MTFFRRFFEPKGTISMKSLEAIKIAVIANAAMIVVARDAFNKKISDSERKLEEVTAELEAATAMLKAVVDSFSASGGDVSE